MMFTISGTQCYLCFYFLTLFCVTKSQVGIFDLADCDEVNLRSCTKYHYVNVTNTPVVLSLKNIPPTSTFFVIQAHSFLTDVVLSNNPIPKLHFYNEGTNVGMVQDTFGQSDFAFYLLNSKKSARVKVLVAVTLYSEKDPIPGGCNLVFDVEKAPFQHINYDSDMIEVSVQAPSVFDRTCEENISNLEIYRIYLPENDYSPESYFHGIEKMLTVESIRRHGWRVYNKTDGLNKLRVLYSAYHGIGSVYAMIAVYKNGESAYVPAVTYACNAKDRIDDCVQPATLFWKAICCIAIVWGLLICSVGFLFSLFYTYLFTGFVFGLLIIYIINTSKSSGLLENYRYTVAYTSVFTYAVLWLLIWYKCSSLRWITELLLNGMLIASFFMHAVIGDLSLFTNNMNYWVVFWGIVMIVAMVQGVCCLAQINTNGVLGAFITVLAIDHFVGSYVRYIVINAIRRLTVENFNLAIISPPCQFSDVLLYCFCLVLLVFTALFNYCLPMDSGELSEMTPLLGYNSY